MPRRRIGPLTASGHFIGAASRFRKAKRIASSSRRRKYVGGVKKRSRSAGVSTTRRSTWRGFKRSKSRGGGVSKSFVAKLSRALTAVQHLQYSLQDRITVTGTLNSVATQIMWTGLKLLTQGGVTITGARNALHLDDPKVLLECGYQASAGGVDIAPNKIVRNSYKTMYKITNAQSSPCEIWEYRCMARQDLSAAAFDTVEEVLASAFGRTGTGTQLGTAVISSTVPYATPYMSNPFVTQFKILKVKKRTLMPARWWTLKYARLKPKQFNLGKFMQGGVFDASTDEPTIKMARGDTFSLFVAKGTAASNEESNAGFEIGLSNVNLLVELMVNVAFCQVKGELQATAGGTRLAGFGNSAQIPLPQVQNQPLYTIITGNPAAAIGTQGDVVHMVGQAPGNTGLTGGCDVPMCEPESGPFSAV